MASSRENSPRQPLLAIENAVRLIGEKRLLDDVSVQLHTGSTLGISGESGSGKSTLLRAIAKLDRLDSGVVKFREQVIQADAVPEFRREVAYLAQRPAMIAGSVAQNLALADAYSSNQKTPQNVTPTRDSTFFTQALLDQGAKTLSGGQQQRVAVDRILRMHPVVLLLDEPTASLDEVSTAALEQTLTSWRAEDPSRSWIWVSHDREQLDRVCQSVVTMQAGRITS